MLALNRIGELCNFWQQKISNRALVFYFHQIFFFQCLRKVILHNRHGVTDKRTPQLRFLLYDIIWILPRSFWNQNNRYVASEFLRKLNTALRRSKSCSVRIETEQ